MKAAVVGCGRMGVFTSESIRQYAPSCWLPQSHADAIAAHPDLSMAALCDPNADTLARASALYPRAEIFTDYRSLLDRFTPAVAGIATRTAGRATIIRDFASAGTRALHVEKPLCNSVAELVELETCFERSDFFVTYGTLRRFFGIYAHAVDIANSGRLGELREIRVDAGSGPLLWTHPHSIDLILFAAGERRPVSVQAIFGEIVDGETPGTVENDPEVLSASIWFEDGIAGHFGRSMGSAVHLHCARGTVSVLANGARVTISELVGEDPYPVQTLAEPLEALPHGPGGSLAPISQLVGCIRGDETAIAANRKVKRDILLGQRILFAMLGSARSFGALYSLWDLDADMAIRGRTGEFYA